MKISTKARYGLRALIELVHLNGEDNYISLKTISDNQKISLNYLESSFSLLKKAGIVESSSGKLGGYKLVMQASLLSVKQVMIAIEGEQKIIENNNVGNKLLICLNKSVWNKIDNRIDDVLSNITLSDLLKGI